jgi:hypothetical protein
MVLLSLKLWMEEACCHHYLPFFLPTKETNQQTNARARNINTRPAKNGSELASCISVQ